MPRIAPAILKPRWFSGTSKRPPLWVLGPETATGTVPIVISGPRTHSGALALGAEKLPTPQGWGRPHEACLATLDVSWRTKPTTTASPHLDSVKVDILQHLIEPRNVARRQLEPALPLRSCRV
jgi:hypothetical protein